MRSAAVMLLLPLLTGDALAHGGEDHADAPAAPAVAIESGPRATAASEDFELIAVAHGKQLLIYLDRFATNEPVAGAEVEVESGAFKAVAHAVGPGVYAVAADTFEKPGSHPLTFTIETDATSGAISDLLAATLEVAAPATAEAAPPSRWPGLAGFGRTPLALLGAVAVVPLAAGAIVLRRRSQRQDKDPTQ